MNSAVTNLEPSVASETCGMGCASRPPPEAARGVSMGSSAGAARWSVTAVYSSLCPRPVPFVPSPAQAPLLRDSAGGEGKRGR